MQDPRGKTQEGRRRKVREVRSKTQNARAKGKENAMIQSYNDLKVYGLSYELAMEIFWMTKDFPSEELYVLTTQIRKSSRSVPSNIAEGWSKRRHENIFRRHLLDSTGSCDETKVWLDFSLDCKYITDPKHQDLTGRYEEVGKMLHGLVENWTTFDK